MAQGCLLRWSVEQLLLLPGRNQHADRLRATRVYQIVNPANGMTLLRGHVDFVCVNRDSGRPTRMPGEFFEAYVETLQLEEN